MQLSREEIEKSERIWRLNLINSISGIKPANLIGTKSKAGDENVAIFSSVVHLGSQPAQLGFIMRPQSQSPRDTYRNILDTGFYTINHIAIPFVRKAHYTSAKLENTTSEFDRMKIEKEYLADFQAPFVRDSAVKIGMKFMEGVPLPNGCILMIGEVEILDIPDSAINESGQLNLSDLSGVGISGLDTYYQLSKIDTFPYVRTDEIPDFE